MIDSLHEIAVNAAPHAVFVLLSTSAGIQSWWTDLANAQPSVGHVNVFGFDGGSVEMHFRVDRNQPPLAIGWTCVPGPRVPGEWVDTRIVAQLTAGPHGKTTTLRFRHENWRSADGAFAMCNTTWGELMHRLRDAAEGKQPGPRFRSNP